MIAVRVGTADDLAGFELAMPTNGLDAHAWHLGEQDRGDATWLVALLDGEPAGTGTLRWIGSLNEQTRTALPAAAELNNLGVRADLRGRGIGTALVAYAESLARTRNRLLITMGVGDDNPNAARLYQRLGYVATGLIVTDRYLYPDDAGIPREIVEHTRVLVKTLA